MIIFTITDFSEVKSVVEDRRESVWVGLWTPHPTFSQNETKFETTL